MQDNNASVIVSNNVILVKCKFPSRTQHYKFEFMLGISTINPS